MNGKGMFRTAALAIVVGVGLPSLAAAETPWARLLSTSRVDADPAKDYPIQQENGPWMIMACSFSGDGAEKQAKDLVLELRSRYKIEAYVHKVHFKLDDPNGPGANAPGAPVHWTYRSIHDRPDMYKDGAIKEVAVIAGNFAAVDDPEAQRVLKKIKSVEPDCLNIDKGGSTSRSLAGLRKMQDYWKEKLMPEKDEAHMKKGPMGHAFITTNPLLPSDYYAPKGGVDELVLRMNKNVPYSLLDCPGKFTVQVATFKGTVELDQKEIQKIERGEKKLGSSLAKAAEVAHELTLALRQKGYEAYEFHDRYASIVTVGSFNSVGTPRADGKIEINPTIHAIMKAFGGPPDDTKQAQSGMLSVKSIIGIPLDYQPIPVEVPKRSISRELAQRLENE